MQNFNSLSFPSWAVGVEGQFWGLHFLNWKLLYSNNHDVRSLELFGIDCSIVIITVDDEKERLRPRFGLLLQHGVYPLPQAYRLFNRLVGDQVVLLSALLLLLIRLFRFWFQHPNVPTRIGSKLSFTSTIISPSRRYANK